MRMLVVSFFLIFICVSGSVQAGVARCEGCSSSGFRAKAISLGVGNHTITSLSTNVIKQFYVFEEPDYYRDESKFFASEVNVPSDLEEIFIVAYGFYQATGGAMHAVIEVNAGDLGVPGLDTATAYDVMIDSNLKGRLGDRLAQGQLPGVFNQLDRAGEMMVQGAFAFIGVSDGSIEITVKMTGGSIVVYKLSASSATGKYLEGRSRTSGGQTIPEANSPAYQGTWYGAGNFGFNDNLSGLADYLDRLGASITFNGDSGREMTCTWDGVALNCKIL